MQPDLDALAYKLGVPAAGHAALDPCRTLVQDRSTSGVRARWVGLRVEGRCGHLNDDVSECVLPTQGDPPTGEVLACAVVSTGNGNRAGGGMVSRRYVLRDEPTVNKGRNSLF